MTWRQFAGCLLAAAACALWLRFPGFSQSPPAPIRFEYQAIPFVLENSVTPRKHLPETMPGGVAVFDFDNDGYPDIFFTNGAEMPGLQKSSTKFSNRLFRNNGHGGFEDVTAKAGLAGTGYDIGVAVGDFNNDGFKDLFVAGVYRNTLYRNNGDGTFTDITAKAGLAKPDERYGRLWGVAAAWLDFDGDGLLDLFVVNYCIWDPQKEIRCETGGKPDYCHPKNYEGLPNSLYRNNGDGTFTDVSASSGIRKYVGRGMSAAVADYDGDGRPDIFVTNDKLFNFLFHNDGGGKFSEKAFDAGVAATEDGNPVSGMGVDFRDINNDGLPDLFFTALPDETFPLYINAGKGKIRRSHSRQQVEHHHPSDGRLGSGDLRLRQRWLERHLRGAQRSAFARRLPRRSRPPAEQRPAQPRQRQDGGRDRIGGLAGAASPDASRRRVWRLQSRRPHRCSGLGARS